MAARDRFGVMCADSGEGDAKADVQLRAAIRGCWAAGIMTIGNISGLSFDEYVWNDCS